MPDERFDASWLALREPVDHRSRAEELLTRLQSHLSGTGRVRVVDLGSGTGSNLRYLAPRLDVEQHWRLVDRDASLLARVTAAGEVGSICTVVAELGAWSSLGLDEADLVTASALLDLVSERWLTALVERCRTGSCLVLLSLTYDGAITWADTRLPSGSVHDRDEDDELVRRLVNEHQAGDKGLGPALGPRAARVADALFQRAGYRTWLVPTPWRLSGESAELARRLVDGWASAAAAVAPPLADRVQAWAGRRRRLVASGVFELTVGHHDLLALPPAPDSA